MLQPEILRVPVAGGTLTVGRWGHGDQIVLAPHGITANHLSWAYIAEALGDEVTLLAPDLRGRGASAATPGPYGMATHAADLIAALDFVGGDTALVAGHSMGGFVAVKAALNHAERLTGIVLIDGGLALPVPEGLDIDTVLMAVIGPAMERLGKTFESREAYRDYWRAHPALAGHFNELAQAYVDYDIHEVDGAWRSKVLVEAIRADGRDTLLDGSLAAGLPTISLPMRFLRAPRGILDADPLYPPALVDDFVARIDHLTAVDLDDVNHYTLALSRHGAAQVAAQIRWTLGAA